MIHGLFITTFTSKGKLKQIICHYLADLSQAPLGTILILLLWKTQLHFKVAKITKKNKAEWDVFSFPLEQLKKKITRIGNSPRWSSKYSGSHLNCLNWLFPQPLQWGYSGHKGQHSRCCLVKEHFGVWDGGFGAGLCIQEFIFCCDFSFSLIFPIIKEGCGAAGEMQRAVGVLWVSSM